MNKLIKILWIISTFLGIYLLTKFIIATASYFKILYTNETCLSLDKFGQIGDFVGGFGGTTFAFVSLLLLYDTLISQLKDSKLNRELAQIQQFENTFYQLLDLHNRNIETIESFDLIGTKIKGKKFFDEKKNELYNIFVPTLSLSKNYKVAVSNYELVYNMNIEIFSTYFKTLYQLYKLIDTENIPNEHRIKYSKILRAQFTSSELFFIRYNAMSEIGDESVFYINKYNYLKHLSNFELLEFKKWWNNLDKFEKNGLGHIFNDLKHLLKNIIDDRNTDVLEKVFKQGKYKILITSTENFKLELKITIDPNRRPTGKFLIDGLDKFSNREIEILFKYVTREYLLHSNFNKFNNRRRLDIQSRIDRDEIVVSILQLHDNRINFYRKNFT